MKSRRDELVRLNLSLTKRESVTLQPMPSEKILARCFRSCMSITEGSKQFLGPILGVKQTPKTNGYSSQHEQKDVFSPKQGKCNSNCPNLCRFGTKVAKRQGRTAPCLIFSGIWRANDLLLNQSCSARERLPGRVEELDAEDLSDLSITMKAV